NRPLSSSLSPDASTERTSLSLHDALPISSLVLAGPRALAAAGGAMTALWQHGVAALSRLLARREVSPVELLEVALARIEKLNPEIGRAHVWTRVTRKSRVPASAREHNDQI